MLGNVCGGVTITKGDNKLNADLILSIYKIKTEEGENTKKTKIFFFLKRRFFFNGKVFQVRTETG